MTGFLPTFRNAKWTVTSLHDSLIENLAKSTASTMLTVYAYAVTEAGWRQLRRPITEWANAKPARKVQAFIGTDHGLTDPEALRQMDSDGVQTHLLIEYTGVYHPKVFWLAGKKHKVWIGSNNLTFDGLMQNIEFASLLEADEIDAGFVRWANIVKHSSELLTPNALQSYEAERREFAKRRAVTGTFTWSKRREPPSSPPVTEKKTAKKKASKVAKPPTTQLTPQAGDLVIEIMPKETGQDGKQVQLPLNAVSSYFGLANRRGATAQIVLRRLGSPYRKTLTLTVFKNDTSRLSINDLDYRDRPCFVIFRKIGNNDFVFEIISRSVFPDRYKEMAVIAVNQTRAGSRRWGTA